MRILKPGDSCPCCAQPIREGLDPETLYLLSWMQYGKDLQAALRTPEPAGAGAGGVDLSTPPPNDPLTISELREMDGEPVWIETFVVGLKSHWGIVHGNYISDGKLPNEKGKCLLLIGDTGGYDIAWLAYRRKPEEETT